MGNNIGSLLEPLPERISRETVAALAGEMWPEVADRFDELADVHGGMTKHAVADEHASSVVWRVPSSAELVTVLPPALCTDGGDDGLGLRVEIALEVRAPRLRDMALGETMGDGPN